ncbi:hypothetical protein TSUD_316800 [Trifolium subterraneum]|uniref:Uncharacterized protein n=1 Tax=Trifolium subterraneum TaxID=3900 RepID=A0A2Z6MXJ8_TRISU|nr:hypothetical protein TSUD_316800 [Trifolium subterraneum]
MRIDMYFFTCNNSVLARQTAGLDQIIATRLQRFRTAREVIMAICNEGDCKTTGQVAMLLWTLWNNRNDKVWNDSITPGRSLGIKASQLYGKNGPRCSRYIMRTSSNRWLSSFNNETVGRNLQWDGLHVTWMLVFIMTGTKLPWAGA